MNLNNEIKAISGLLSINSNIEEKSNLDNNSSIFGNPTKDFNNLVNYYLNKKRERLSTLSLKFIKLLLTVFNRERTDNIYEKYFNDFIDFIKEFDKIINYNTPDEILKKNNG